MINPMAGGLQISATGKYKKVVLLISDGLPQNEPHTTQIIEEANKQDCAIYCMTIGRPSPKCMKDMSLQTGGHFIDNITSAQEAELQSLNSLALVPVEVRASSSGSVLHDVLQDIHSPN